jgi:hypothetical protein
VIYRREAQQHFVLKTSRMICAWLPFNSCRRLPHAMRELCSYEIRWLVSHLCVMWAATGRGFRQIVPGVFSSGCTLPITSRGREWRLAHSYKTAY